MSDCECWAFAQHWGIILLLISTDRSATFSRAGRSVYSRQRSHCAGVGPKEPGRPRNMWKQVETGGNAFLCFCNYGRGWFFGSLFGMRNKNKYLFLYVKNECLWSCFPVKREGSFEPFWKKGPCLLSTKPVSPAPQSFKETCQEVLGYRPPKKQTPQKTIWLWVKTGYL